MSGHDLSGNSNSAIAPDNVNSNTFSVNGPEKHARVALTAIFLFCIVGIGIALDLANIYVASRTDPDFQSFCSVSDGINCTSVALSEYSTLLNTPVAVWAMAGYIFAAFLAGMAAVRRKTGFGLGFLFLFGCLFCLVSIWLIVLMAFIIHSLCILCLAIDIINFTFIGMAIFAIRMTGKTIPGAIRDDFIDIFRHPLRLALLAVVGFGVLGAAAAIGPSIVSTSNDQISNITLTGQKSQDNASCGAAEHSIPSETQRGMTPDGHPWIGAANPKIEIQEFTDYQCPFCRKAHMMVRQLVATNPDVRVYHRHLPLDNACNPSIEKPFHARACEYSKISVCAGEQGRFWEMNDLLFQHSDEIRTKELSAADIAERLELDIDKFTCCLNDESRFDVIKNDIKEGNELGLKGTPAFIINGNIYYGKIPPEALKGGE